MNVDLFPFSFKKHKNKNVLENTILQSIVWKTTHCIRIQLNFWPLYMSIKFILRFAFFILHYFQPGLMTTVTFKEQVKGWSRIRPPLRLALWAPVTKWFTGVQI